MGCFWEAETRSKMDHDQVEQTSHHKHYTQNMNQSREISSDC